MSSYTAAIRHIDAPMTQRCGIDATFYIVLRQPIHFKQAGSILRTKKNNLVRGDGSQPKDQVLKNCFGIGIDRASKENTR